MRQNDKLRKSFFVLALGLQTKVSNLRVDALSVSREATKRKNIINKLKL